MLAVGYGISKSILRVLSGILILGFIRFSLMEMHEVSVAFSYEKAARALHDLAQQPLSTLHGDKNIASVYDDYIDRIKDQYHYPRENATFVTLARNEDLSSMLNTVRSIEDRFNNRYHYDWVFLNDRPFTAEFISVISSLVSGEAKFGKISDDHWGTPEWINTTYAEGVRDEMKKERIIYGDSESYRHMCRYESGLFYHHPLMQSYRYYWRVEPNTLYHCDVKYDVFEFMRANNKVYGFTLALLEFPKTVQTLWQTTMDFLERFPQFKHENSMERFVTDSDSEGYNFCHFWSNFEVGDMDFWRGDAYSRYFDYLDKSGGFFYERWGDAPIHSIAVSLFADKNQIHFFDDIGYTHPPYTHCPTNCGEKNLTCSCLPSDNFDWTTFSCLNKFYKTQSIDVPGEVDVDGIQNAQKSWKESADRLKPVVHPEHHLPPVLLTDKSSAPNPNTEALAEAAASAKDTKASSI